MATSVATLMYGTYTFRPIPQIGIQNDCPRIGENRTGPGNRVRVVTLVGHVTGNNLNEIQTKVVALETAWAKQGQTLYWHDGVQERINCVAQPSGIQWPAEWGQYEARYTATLMYIPLDDVHNAAATVSFQPTTGPLFTFSTLGTDSAMPIMGRDFSVERETPDAARGCSRVKLSLSGFFDEGSITANVARLNALAAALAYEGIFTFGTMVQTVKVDSWSHTPDIMDRRVGYAIGLHYETNLSAGNIKKMVCSRRVTRVNYRSAPHFIPFLNYASTQILGLGAQQVQTSGYVICTTMAEARTAASAKIDTQFPTVPTPGDLQGYYGWNYKGVELDNSEITEKEDEARVDWSVTRRYAIPALTAGIYSGV